MDEQLIQNRTNRAMLKIFRKQGRCTQPRLRAETDAQANRYREVIQELCRGIKMVTDLSAEPSSIPGWIRVNCVNRGTADWLLRAITMESVSVRCEGLELVCSTLKA